MKLPLDKRILVKFILANEETSYKAVLEIQKTNKIITIVFKNKYGGGLIYHCGRSENKTIEEIIVEVNSYFASVHKTT